MHGRVIKNGYLTEMETVRRFLCCIEKWGLLREFCGFGAWAVVGGAKQVISELPGFTNMPTIL